MKETKPQDLVQVLGLEIERPGSGQGFLCHPLPDDARLSGTQEMTQPAVGISEPNFSSNAGQSDAGYSLSYSLRRPPAISLPRISALKAAGPKGQIDRSSELQRCVASLVRGFAGLLCRKARAQPARWGGHRVFCWFYPLVLSSFFPGKFLCHKTRRRGARSVNCHMSDTRQASPAAKDQCSLPRNPRRVATLNIAGDVSKRRSTVY